MEKGGAKSSARKAQSHRVRNLLFGGQIICDWHGLAVLFVGFKNRLHDTRIVRPVKHDHLFCSEIRTGERDQWVVLGFSGKSTLHAARPKWRLGEINCEPSVKHCIGSMAKSSRPSTSPYSASALIEGTERSGRKVESEMSTERPCTEPIRWGITAGLHCAGISVCSIPN